MLQTVVNWKNIKHKTLANMVLREEIPLSTELAHHLATSLIEEVDNNTALTNKSSAMNNLYEQQLQEAKTQIAIKDKIIAEQEQELIQAKSSDINQDILQQKITQLEQLIEGLNQREAQWNEVYSQQKNKITELDNNLNEALACNQRQADDLKSAEDEINELSKELKRTQKAADKIDEDIRKSVYHAIEPQIDPSRKDILRKIIFSKSTEKLSKIKPKGSDNDEPDDDLDPNYDGTSPEDDEDEDEDDEHQSPEDIDLVPSNPKSPTEPEAPVAPTDKDTGSEQKPADQGKSNGGDKSNSSKRKGKAKSSNRTPRTIKHDGKWKGTPCQLKGCTGTYNTKYNCYLNEIITEISEKIRHIFAIYVCDLCGHKLRPAAHKLSEENRAFRANESIITAKRPLALCNTTIAIATSLVTSSKLPIDAARKSAIFGPQEISKGTMYNSLRYLHEKLLPVAKLNKTLAALCKTQYIDESGAILILKPGDKSAGPKGQTRSAYYVLGHIGETNGIKFGNLSISAERCSPKERLLELNTTCKNQLYERYPHLKALLPDKQSIMSDCSSRNGSYNDDDKDMLGHIKPEAALRELGQEYIVGACLVHGRRPWARQLKVHNCKFSKEVLEEIKIVYKTEAEAKEKNMTAAERLAYHKLHSLPVKERLKQKFTAKLQSSNLEENSKLADNLRYMRKHIETMFMFTHEEDVPLDNNECERLVRQFKIKEARSYFFKTTSGADLILDLMSIDITCAEAEVDLLKYYIKILETPANEIYANPLKYHPLVLMGVVKEKNPFEHIKPEDSAEQSTKPDAPDTDSQ